jgi:phage terminase large subunit GpA-like protein
MLDAFRDELTWFVARCRVPKLRTMRQFAEEEIVIPDGPYRGLLFRADRQPYAAHALDAMDSGKWTRFAAVGPTQSGKTLLWFIIPLLYHLFELDETVVVAIPDMKMAYDKWVQDIRPIIERTRYAEKIPRVGRGSRGGEFDSIKFTNGATLKFMSGGGDDKNRAAFTTRVVVITEADGMDTTGESSREADKITQIEARTRAYDDRKRVYMECTASIEKGRIWREYTNGTESKIVTPCPHCGEYVCLDREHLHGWKEATDEFEAAKDAAFHCPECGAAWSEDDRLQANRESRLLLKGQTIDRKGQVSGDEPKTSTFGFRWSAVNNLFTSMASLGHQEWKAARADDEENAEKEMRQFVWALPWDPPVVDLTRLDWRILVKRTRSTARGVMPQEHEYLTVHADLHEVQPIYWTAWSFSETFDAHAVDYGVIDVHFADLGLHRAVAVALLEFQRMCEAGWMRQGRGIKTPDQAWVDSGALTEVAYEFCRKAGQPFFPAKGYGAGQERTGFYNAPRNTGSVIREIGEQYHVSHLRKQRVRLCEVNADHWKGRVHAALSIETGQPGAATLFDATQRDHLSFCKHLTAERKQEEFKPERGVITRFIRTAKANHWLDNTYNCFAAAHRAGARLLGDERPKRRPRTSGEWFKGRGNRRA